MAAAIRVRLKWMAVENRPRLIMHPQKLQSRRFLPPTGLEIDPLWGWNGRHNAQNAAMGVSPGETDNYRATTISFN